MLYRILISALIFFSMINSAKSKEYNVEKSSGMVFSKNTHIVESVKFCIAEYPSKKSIYKKELLEWSERHKHILDTVKKKMAQLSKDRPIVMANVKLGIKSFIEKSIDTIFGLSPGRSCKLLLKELIGKKRELSICCAHDVETLELYRKYPERWDKKNLTNASD
ncbi:MAG: hypothetical protein COA86_12685 [Kangiella sp.]|nr:MAG: hypothetical protein COA86_12685 [Kangiella sp.]